MKCVTNINISSIYLTIGTAQRSGHLDPYMFVPGKREVRSLKPISCIPFGLYPKEEPQSGISLPPAAQIQIWRQKDMKRE